MLTRRINTYFALLMITIIASGATLLIVHVAYATNFSSPGDGEAAYLELKNSILKENAQQPVAPMR